MELARSKTYPAGQVSFSRADAHDPAAIPGQFTAIFAGFFWSHVPRSGLGDFLDRLGRRLGNGGRIVLIDNRYVPGSSTAISETDAEGNTYQSRRLDDGSIHRVLKNFPDERDLRDAAQPFGEDLRVTMLTYFWCLAFTARCD